MMLPVKKITSPDGRSTALLTPAAGGSPWEITYATLELAGLSFGCRMFGWRGIWSTCSRYFAVTEWRHDGPSSGPHMELVIIDVAEKKEGVLDRSEDGFVEPLRFDEGTIRYGMITMSMRDRGLTERSLADVPVWQPVSGLPPDSGLLPEREQGW